MQTIGSQKEISLYFHIPFCTKKCHYCHFYVLPDQEQSKDELLKAFKLEWKKWLPALENKTVSTIYFGGGTPFLFGPNRIESLLNLIKQTASISLEPEITLEANPENVTFSIMQDYHRSGINRVSLGIQTLDNDLLILLGRHHQSNIAIRAVHTIAEAGIQNISVDLMYDLPNQTLNHWESTLQSVSILPITHLSLYNLTIEPHTFFFKQREALKKLLPNEEISLEMYQRAIQVMENKGLMQYEISAFSKPGYQSHHNIGYWTARPFLGFGPSAFSYWYNKRFRNIANLKKYCHNLQLEQTTVDFEEQLNPCDLIKELLVIQMRLKTGVDLQKFQEKHGIIDDNTWQTLQHLQTEKFIRLDSNLITLTERGILFYDTVASELI